MSCNTYRHNSCHCGTGCAKQMAAPTFMEDLYQFATNNNLFEGTIQEFLQFMRGPGGDDIYTWSVKHGFFSGTKTEFFLSLHGPGINIIGELNNPSELPTTGNKLGDAYTIGRDLYIFSQGEDPNGPGSFVLVPDFKGPKGDKGDPGDGSGLEDYYTREEVDQKFEDLPEPDLSKYLQKDVENTISSVVPTVLKNAKGEIGFNIGDYGTYIQLIRGTNRTDIQDNAVSVTTPTNSSNLFVNSLNFSESNQLLTSYHPFGIDFKKDISHYQYVLSYPNTGALTQDENVVLPLSVNGVFADTKGDITIPTGGDSQNLQQVLDVGSFATISEPFDIKVGANSRLRVDTSSFDYSAKGDIFNNLIITDYDFELSSNYIGSDPSFKDLSSFFGGGISSISLGTDVVNTNNKRAEIRLFSSLDDNDYSIVVMDKSRQIGMVYESDYSTNGKLNDLWIPNWASVKTYVEENVGSVELGSGLYKDTDGKINLGISADGSMGLIDAPTYIISGDILNGKMLGVQIAPDAGAEIVNIAETSSASIGTDASSNISFGRQKNSNFQSITFNSTNLMLVTDAINNKGLEYPTDYSANFTDHSLVTKKFVLDNAGGSLQSVTTGTGKNITSNAIQVIGINNFDINQDGLIMFTNGGTSAISRITGGALVSGLSLSETFIQLSRGSALALDLTDDSPTFAGAAFHTRVSGLEAQLNNEFVTKAQLDAASGGGGNLQSVTTGAGNNATSNSIIITGNSESDITKNGLHFLRDDSDANIVQVHGGEVKGNIHFNANGNVELVYNNTNLSVGNETLQNAGVSTQNRISGQPAINSNEFVTKAQLDKSAIVEIDNTTINLSKADLNTDFPLATYPIGTQIFCPETSTKYTRVYDDIWVSELFSEVL